MNVGQAAAELSPFELVLSKLIGIKRWASGGAMARCPSPGHPDKTASLSLNEAVDGKVLMHCHAGCTPETIVEALGLKIADLFPDKEPPLKSVKVVATYDYRDAEGRLVYQVVRYEPKKFKQRRLAGRGGWIWDLKGVTPLLYKLPELLSADPDEWVCISEGEKDVDNLNRLDFVATCNSGGALKFRPEHAEHLKDR